MTFENILYQVEDGIALLTVNQPRRLNALNSQTIAETGQAVDAAAQDANVRALIITGAGEKAFVAGADIEELARMNAVEGQRTSDRGQQVFNQIENLDKPAIAAINGFALGGGLELALACHLRVASENAVMGLPEVGLGIIPGYGGTQRLARLVGRGYALDMVLTGRKVKADEAERMGLVNRVVATGEAMSGARDLTGRILNNGPLAVAFALRAVRRGLDMSLADGQSYEASLFGLASATEDMKEGLTAFLEKRRPAFTGK